MSMERDLKTTKNNKRFLVNIELHWDWLSCSTGQWLTWSSLYLGLRNLQSIVLYTFNRRAVKYCIPFINFPYCMFTRYIFICCLWLPSLFIHTSAISRVGIEVDCYAWDDGKFRQPSTRRAYPRQRESALSLLLGMTAQDPRCLQRAVGMCDSVGTWGEDDGISFELIIWCQPSF